MIPIENLKKRFEEFKVCSTAEEKENDLFIFLRNQ